MTTSSIAPNVFGADYAAASAIDTNALYAAGARFVCRYLSVSSSSWKVITSSERDTIFESGLGLLLNWEVGSSDWQKSSEAASWGRQAADQASALGYPTSLPIIASIDSGLSGSQVDQAVDYLTKFKAAAGGYPLGVYGGSTIANAIGAEATFVWATNASSWGTDFNSTPDVQQHTNSSSRYPQFAAFGNNIDVNQTLQAIEVWGSVSGASTGSSSSSTSTGSSSSSSTSSTSGSTYTVQAGDSWWGIAEKLLGTGSKDTELASANGKTTGDVLQPGDVLQLPYTDYTVQSGDSWWGIAEQQMGSGSKDNELAAFNGKTINDPLEPGDALKIPTG